MLERADARLWFSIIAAASAFPAVVFVIWAAWFMRFYFAPPMNLAATPPGPPVLARVEAAVPPPAAEPVAPPLAAQTLEPLSTNPTLGDSHPTSSDSAQDVSTVESIVMPVKPAAPEPSEPMTSPVPVLPKQAEAPAQQPKQPPTEMSEVVVAPPPDAEASELASAPLAVASPRLGDAHSDHSDPALASTVEFPVTPAEPAALNPSKPIEGPIPLPRPRPRVTAAHFRRTVSMPRLPPIESSANPTFRH